jgi:hypothetical protein
MEFSNLNMTMCFRPLPIGSGDDSYSTQWPRPRPSGKGAAAKNLDEQTAKQKLSQDSTVLIRTDGRLGTVSKAH